jgi:hypothetical protein
MRALAVAGALAVLVLGAGWKEFDDPAHGLVVRYPGDWHRAKTSLTPNLADPREILAVGTGRMARHGPGCAHMPVGALNALRPGDVLITVLERRHPGGSYPPRRPLHLRRGGDLTEATTCATNRHIQAWWRPFSDEGRAFYVLGAAGDRVPGARLHEAERVVDGIRFRKGG